VRALFLLHCPAVPLPRCHAWTALLKWRCSCSWKPHTIPHAPTPALMACRCACLPVCCRLLMAVTMTLHNLPEVGHRRVRSCRVPACLPACLPCRPLHPALLIAAGGRHASFFPQRPPTICADGSACPAPLPPCLPRFRALLWHLPPSQTLGRSWPSPSPCTTFQRWVGEERRGAVQAGAVRGSAGWGGVGWGGVGWGGVGWGGVEVRAGGGREATTALAKTFPVLRPPSSRRYD
jgi:hypothetical protein